MHNLASHRHESRLDVGGVLGRSLHKFNSQTVSKLLGRLVRHHLLGGQIGLVSDEQLDDVLVGIAVNLVKPRLDIVERILVCDVVHDDDSVGAAVVAGRNRSKSFLAGGIPLLLSSRREEYNLELHRLSIQIHGADLLPMRLIRNDYEVDTNSGNVAIRVLIIRKTQQKAGLTDAGISNQQKLEKIVATVR